MQDATEKVSAVLERGSLAEIQDILRRVKKKEVRYHYELLCQDLPELEDLLVQALLHISDFRLYKKRLHKHTSETDLISLDGQKSLFEAIKEASHKNQEEDVYFLAYYAKEPKKVRTIYQRMMAAVSLYFSDIQNWKNSLYRMGLVAKDCFPELTQIEAELNEFRTSTEC